MECARHVHTRDVHYVEKRALAQRGDAERSTAAGGRTREHGLYLAGGRTREHVYI